MAAQKPPYKNGHPISSGSSSALGHREQDEYGFQFVEFRGPSSHHDEEARSAVRAHVMRDFHEKKKHRRESSGQAEVASTASMKEGASQQIHRYKMGPQGLREVTKKPKQQGSVRHRTRHPISLITGSGIVPEDGQAKPSRARLVEQVEVGDAACFTLSCNSRGHSRGIAGAGQWGKEDALSLDGRDVSIKPDILASALGPGDPFDTLPLPNSPLTRILLYHANNSILSSPLMGQLRTEWLSLAIQDLALINVALSHYAGNYGLTHLDTDPAEALRFRMESMKIVNGRLPDQEIALADGTLGTVASLSSYEATNGTLSAARAHIQGLKRMVDLRGGLKESGINQYTTRLVLWADLNTANALSCDPIFPPLECQSTKTYERCPQALRYTASCATPLQEDTAASLTELQTLHKDLADRFMKLRFLSSISSMADLRHIVKKDAQIGMSDEVYLTERSLLALSNVSAPRSFVTSCCIAAIIFIDNHFRDIDFIARLIGRLVVRLQQSMQLFLDDISNSAANSITPKAVLWALYVGGTSAASRPERGWFVANLVEFCDLLDLHCWENARLILRTFIWPAAWDVHGRCLWDCVEEARVMRHGRLTGARNIQFAAELTPQPF